MTNWQPIETAPTDQRVLVFTIDYIEVAERKDLYRGIRGGWFGDNFDSYGELPQIEPTPTHWMPLPEQP